MTTSAAYSLDLQLELDGDHAAALDALVRLVAEAGGWLRHLSTPPSQERSGFVEAVIDTASEADMAGLRRAVESIDGLTVRHALDRTVERHRGGKIRVASAHPLDTVDELSMAYTPGVARISERVADDRGQARELTIRGNSVAIVTDGSAVLGLGDIGPIGALPVMEGKAALFGQFAGIDAWPLCLDAATPDDIVAATRAIAPSFGGINLEDIAAPACFEVEDRLRDELDIPVFHDDQHGTAVVLLAALRNALRLVDKELSDCRVVLSGAGAAGVAIAKLLHAEGVGSFVACDRQGVLHPGRGGLTETKRWLAAHSDPGAGDAPLRGALDGADVFVGVSGPDVLAPSELSVMARDAIVFALANPVPEVNPAGAREHAAVVATGRSDEPNQINNVLAFPGIFRGALNAGAADITDEMKLAAAHAIADVVVDRLRPDEIVPSVLDAAVAPAVADAVAQAAPRA